MRISDWSSDVCASDLWVEKAAEPSALVTMDQLQRAVAKWAPRGLEMFGDERGGDTNVRLGLKDKSNRQAHDEFIAECQQKLEGRKRVVQGKSVSVRVDPGGRGIINKNKQKKSI